MDGSSRGRDEVVSLFFRKKSWCVVSVSAVWCWMIDLQLIAGPVGRNRGKGKRDNGNGAGDSTVIAHTSPCLQIPSLKQNRSTETRCCLSHKTLLG